MKPIISQTTQKGKANPKKLPVEDAAGLPRMTIGQLLIRLLDEGKRLPRIGGSLKAGVKRASI